MTQRSCAEVTAFRILAVVLTACWIAALATPVAASSPGEKEEPERLASEKADTEVGAEASDAAPAVMKVFVDPETGEIISVPIRQQTGTLSAPLAKALTRSTEGLWVFELSNGGKGVHLDGRFQHAIMVRVKPDGSFETVCVDHSHQAEGFLKSKRAETDPQPRDQ
jgi:hypothetical protein